MQALTTRIFFREQNSFAFSYGRRAFTQLELLIVISILAIIAALTVPVIGKMIKSADRTNAVSNLRQLGVAFQLYSNEHNGRLPIVFHVNSNPAGYWRRATLQYAGLDPNYKATGDALFNSPFLSPVIVDAITENGGRPYITSFAMNQLLIRYDGQGGELGFPLAAITDPSNTLLATEGTLGSTGKATIPDYAINEAKLLANEPKNTYNNGRDVLMVDGSIRFFEGKDALALPPYNLGSSDDVWTP